MIRDRAGGPSRESSWEVDVDRKSTSPTRGCSMQMLCGTVHAPRATCLLTPSPEVDPHSACVFMRSGVCLMRATSVLCLASGLAGETHNVGEFLRNKKEIPQGCGKFFKNKKALIDAPWPQRGNDLSFPLHRGPGPWGSLLGSGDCPSIPQLSTFPVSARGMEFLGAGQDSSRR